MRILTADGRARTRLALLAALGAALALAGAAKIGNAATNGVLTATTTVLNDSSPLIAGQPTPGGNIGYDLNLDNQSSNAVNHIAFTDTTNPAGTIVYINAPASVSCSGMGTATLSCTSSQLASGAHFDVIVLFQTDSSAARGSTISNTGSGTYAPASNNPTNNRTDPTKTFVWGAGADRQFAGTGLFFEQSLLLPFDQHGQGKLTVGGVVGQSASVTMPSGFFQTAFVGTTLQTKSGVIATPASGCPSTCQPYETDTTIPTAATFGADPFFDGTNANPYSWSLTIPVPNGFKPTGVFHTDENGANGFIVQLCSVTPVTSPPGICMTAPPTLNKRVSPNTATYSGIGVVNGHGWGF